MKHYSQKYKVRRRIFMLGLALMVSAVGLQFYLHRSRAATLAVNAQAESATLLGAASKVSDANASGGSAVAFGGGSCTAAANATLQDQDAAPVLDSWPHKVPNKTVIYFATGQLNSEYSAYVVTAAKAWSNSSCIDARTTASCTGLSPCVPMTLVASGPSAGVTGQTFLDYSGSSYYKSNIEIYTNATSQMTPTMRQGTVAHEMGHALGLNHRATRVKLLYSTNASDRANLPDASDFSNLAVLYGKTSTIKSGGVGATGSYVIED